MDAQTGGKADGKGATMDTVTIDGVLYDVVERTDADGAAAKGLTNLADFLRTTGRAQLGLRRPKGRVIYFAVEYGPGHYSSVVSLGRGGR